MFNLNLLDLDYVKMKFLSQKVIILFINMILINSR